MSTSSTPSPNILEEAAKIVGGDRQDVYGHPFHDFSCIAGMWKAYLSKKLGTTITITEQDIGPMMVMVKLARLANTPSHRDSKVDIAGYARCMEMVDEYLKEVVSI